MKVHILDDWFDTLRHQPSFDRLDGHDVTVWTDNESDVGTLAERHAEAETLILFRERTAITEELLARLPNLKLIAMRGVHPHVDVEACTRHGVTFCSDMGKPAVSTAAAELTFALILAAARDLVNQTASLRAGEWQASVGQSVHGRRLGLYGYGRIAKQVADYARAFGMEIVWWGSEDGRARAKADGQTVADSRAAFFAESDVVSVHVRLVPETRGLITADDLLGMTPSAIFINTSRAGLIEDGAVLRALEAERPLRFGLDVWDDEPLRDADHPIATHPRVIGTPHVGFVTEDELDAQFAMIYAQITAFADGAPINVVKPDAAR